MDKLSYHSQSLSVKGLVVIQSLLLHRVEILNGQKTIENLKQYHLIHEAIKECIQVYRKLIKLNYPQHFCIFRVSFQLSFIITLQFYQKTENFLNKYTLNTQFQNVMGEFQGQKGDSISKIQSNQKIPIFRNILDDAYSYKRFFNYLEVVNIITITMIICLIIFLMNVIYHKNCLDGVYSAYLLYLLAKFSDQAVVVSLIEHFNTYKQKDITNQIQDLSQDDPKSKLYFKQLTEDFFLDKNVGVQFSAYGIVAGKYQDRYGPTKSSKRILFIVDNNCESGFYIKRQSQRYDIVLIIDHHTSFKSTKSELEKLKLDNVYYIWKEGQCATQLTLKWLQKHFKFLDGLQPKYRQDLQSIVSYVHKNDLKEAENPESKSFVLGFYYFEIQMSQQNPWLFKRLGMLRLQYILEKGKNVYIKHFQEIQKQIKKANLAYLQPYNSTCLILQPTNPSIISDIGTILSYLSCINGGVNIAILYIPNGNYYRVSCRSYKGLQKDPLALELSLKYNGGGHREAAGFRTSKNSFNGIIKKIGPPKFKLNLTIQEIEQIMFHKIPKIIQQKLQ